TFAQGKFQVSNRQKMVANPIGGTLRFTISISDIGGWGWLTGAERMPPPGIQAQRPRTRTARTTRQILVRSCLVARMIFEEKSSVPAARVQRPIGCTSFSVTLMKRFLTKS
ncbi:MAG: hypothetical protein VXW26_14520, partial [SAR324 cluster bacterium]|nr:hypothetical protein [SAR324 cluster bacterium]